MNEIIIDTNRCKGCGICISVCRAGALELDRAVRTRYGGGAAVYKGGCVGCGNCTVMCPDIALELRRRTA